MPLSLGEDIALCKEVFKLAALMLMLPDCPYENRKQIAELLDHLFDSDSRWELVPKAGWPSY